MVRALGRHTVRALRALTHVEGRHPKEPHWYLGVLGTRTAAQGKGIGSALLAPVLERCDDEGIPAYLESSKHSNIAFYRRHGFEVTGEIALPSGGPSVWPMWRDPQPR
jgi:ribosomal protein S18 acetylase RimI-like enzyme